MSTNLMRLGIKASQDRDLVFTSVYHHISDIDNLRDCFWSLPSKRATGIDGISKAAYGKDLEQNLQDLSARLKRMGYRPKPKRRTYIPKPGSAKGRPLGISSFEDKVVELATKRVLEPLFEPLFEEFSYGYRPNRNPHQCLDALGRTIQQERVNHVVEADIRGFFDNVNHEWLLKFLEQRVGDPRVLRLIRRMLKAGIMEDGLAQAADDGTPQGSILSPLLSNTYLHYVLDLWFQRRLLGRFQGKAYLFRYADDFLACFQYQADADSFRHMLGDRLEGFHLELAEEKTRSLPFGRFARENATRQGGKPGEFTFLGFTFYCGTNRYGTFKVKRKTARKKLRQALFQFTGWLHAMRRRLRTGALIQRAKQKLEGHLGYFAVTDNASQCDLYRYLFTRLLFKWLNRRSQRQSYTWAQFNQVLRHFDWPRVRIRINLNPYSFTPNV